MSLFLIKARMAMEKRVLVYLQKSKDAEASQVPFYKSVVDLCSSNRDLNSADISVRMQSNKLLLCNQVIHEKPWKSLPLTRPTFCPIHSLSEEKIGQLSPRVRDRGVDVGCTVLVHTSDQHVLLVRRAAHLRTFPRLWVAPGGHMEDGESFTETGLRELKEESGLDLNSSECKQNEVSPISMWESTYPAMLSLGLPTRRHIVVSLLANLKEGLTAERLQKRLHLDRDEVDAAVWLPVSVVERIVENIEGYHQSNTSTYSETTDTISITVISESGEQKIESYPVQNFFMVAPTEGADIERVSTGTKYALSRWLDTLKLKKLSVL